jgi:capsular polysaccharide export protein
MNRVGTVDKKNILFLQGPIGFFFRDLDLLFRSKGATTFKITLNSADWLFSNKDNTYPFKGKRDEWQHFIESFLKEKKIDKIFLFGDCRFYQSNAIKVSKQLNVEVFVFEEGYLRPDFITLERDGVNDFSKISRDAQFYRSLSDDYLNIPTAVSAKPIYKQMAFSAIFYYIAGHFFSFKYPNYIHHRESGAVKEFFWWWYHVFLKAKYQLTEKKLLKKITSDWSSRYYFVPLQTHNDYQLTVHSRFDNIEEFITETMQSFALHAPKDTMLLFKHHPQDRGRKDYNTFITNLSTTLGISNRIIVVHDTHLPSCLEHSIATVTINSTVGLSSLIHTKPTITLGKAIYDIEGITAKNMHLDDFWIHNQAPDIELFQKFRTYLLKNTQLNGSFYGKFPVELT